MSLTEVEQQASSFSLEQNEQLSPAWHLEIEQRLEDVRSGQVQTVTHEELRQRVQSSRP